MNYMFLNTVSYVYKCRMINQLWGCYVEFYEKNSYFITAEFLK